MTTIPKTIAGLYNYLKNELQTLSLSTEQIEAESRIIIEDITGIHASLRLIAPDTPISDDHQELIQRLLTKRVSTRTPLQYLLGKANFYGLTFSVTQDVLIPRPETELLVDRVLTYVNQKMPNQPVHILDIGTGSGAIAVTLKRKLGQQAHVSAIDISPAALKVAKQNAEQLHTDILFYEGDVFQALPQMSPRNHFHIIVSNPPYIGEAEKSEMLPEVLEHEPHLALFAPDNYRESIYQRIANEASQWLHPGGSVFVELGQGLGPSVSELFQQARFESIAIHSDFSGIPRVLEAHYPSLKTD